LGNKEFLGRSGQGSDFKVKNLIGKSHNSKKLINYIPNTIGELEDQG